MTWSGPNGQSEAPPAFYTFSSPRMQSSLRDFYLNRTAELFPRAVARMRRSLRQSARSFRRYVRRDVSESARSQPTGRVQRTARAATAKARKYRRRPSAESVRMVGSKKRRQNSSRARNTSRRRGPLQRSSAAVRSNRTRARLNAFSKGGIATRPDGRGSLSRLRCRHSPSARPARSAASPGSCVRA